MHVKSCVFCWKGGRTVKDELIRSQIHQAVDHHSEHLQSNPFLAQRIINQERTGEPVVKKRLSIGLVTTGTIDSDTGGKWFHSG